MTLLPLRQHSALTARWGALVFAILSIISAACGGRGPSANATDASAASSPPGDVARAAMLASGTEALPERAEALALAESIEARAVREGAGSRAVELHAAAAKLLERVWRVEGHEQDAREALELYRAAAHDPGAPGACEAALAAAQLAGSFAHDAATTYAELYRAQRRFAPTTAGDAGVPSTCRNDIESGLSLLVAFRPPQRVLEAIDEGLAGEGAIASAVLAGVDAGALVAAARPPQILRIESWPGKDAARMVVVLDRPAGYRVGDETIAGSRAPRTFLDLDGVDLGSAPREVAGTGIVTRVHAEATTTGSRISADLDGRAWRRVFTMQEPYRIVVDIARNAPGVKGAGARSLARVVLDPGHGGKDAGAIGLAGVKEKDVTLDVAHRVAPVLAAQGLQVVLTRDDDRFVSLEERTARANAFNADLFVSIHCNASESHGRRGVETYVLDTTRDEIATRIAARENATTQAASTELSTILGGMRMADEAQRSTRFARLLQRSSLTAMHMKFPDVVDGGVHAAGFYVLVGARMPSVLFETSYISNAVEEQRLGNADFRQVVADSIVNAVQAYREGR